MLQAVADHVSALVARYVQLVEAAPQPVSQLENVLSACANLPLGSAEWMEFLTTASRLLTMINDTILRRKHDRVNTRSDSASQAAGRGAKWSKARTDVHALQQKLETSLRIIQVLQTLGEILALKAGGSRTRANAVSLLELLKLGLRGTLLLRFGRHLVSFLPNTRLDRKAICCSSCNSMLFKGLCPQCDPVLTEQVMEAATQADEVASPVVILRCPNCNRPVDLRPTAAISVNGEVGLNGTGSSTVGRRTGLTIKPTKRQSRRLQGLACPLCQQRQDRLDRYYAAQHNFERAEHSSPLTLKILFAELCYIVRPSLQLSLYRLLGDNSWIPFVSGLALDQTSLMLQDQHSRQLTSSERAELHRRRLALWIYLLRAPMWKRATRTRVLQVLAVLRMYVPSLGGLCDTALAILDAMQDTQTFTYSH